MERRPQYSILGCVDTEFRENTMCGGVLEREALQTSAKVYAAPDPPESLALHHMGPSQLTPQQIPSCCTQNPGQ